MKKVLLSIAIAFALISCGGSEETKEFESTEQAAKGGNDDEAINAPSTMMTSNPHAFEENLKAFQACKETSKDRSSCKEYIAKAVCEYYGIQDLKEGGNYIDYDKIPEKLKELDSWQKVGAFNEENIQLALEQLNSFGKPVLVFNENDSYVHVVALAPNGNVLTSRKWGNISVPACISYFPTRPAKSFLKNGINYAFGSADGLTIWMKN